jgi:hypothetical protein
MSAQQYFDFTVLKCALCSFSAIVTRCIGIGLLAMPS